MIDTGDIFMAEYVSGGWEEEGNGYLDSKLLRDIIVAQ